MSLHITVHHFNIDSSPPPSIRLLEAARRLVDAATATSSEWHSIIPMSSVVSLSSPGTPKGACFMWARGPPVINRGLSTADREPELLDWDAPMDDNVEIIDLDSLPEFEETDLRDIILHPKSWFTNLTPGLDSQLPPAAGDAGGNSVKRPRSRFSPQIESLSPPPISISRLIPFPHYYESLDPARPPPPGINNIPAFRVARSLTSSASLMTPFARTAWLVPLRGVPPFEGASAAQIDKTLPFNPPPRDETSTRTILWTPAAVTQFWSFLLRQRRTNNFGPIALAYMFSPPSNHKRRRKGRDGKRNGKRKKDATYGEGERRQTKKQTRTSILDEDYDEPTEVSVWEYIKIYHDSQYAMKLRSLLDSFRLEGDTDENREKTIGGTEPIRNRVLKTTQLVLVDETGEAILLA